MSQVTILGMMRWAQRQEPGTAVAKNVLKDLASFADRLGRCFPGQELLARTCGYGTRSIRQALALLEASGYIRRTPRYRRDGSRTTDEYELQLSRDDNPPKAPRRPAAEPPSTGTTQPHPRNLTAAPPESDSGPTTLERTREESTERSEPSGSAPVPGAGPGFDQDLWERSTGILMRLTKWPERRCRGMIGSWLGLVGDNAATVIRAIDDAEEARPVEAVSWIGARLKQGPGPVRKGAASPATPAPAEAIAARQVEALAMAVRGEWPIGGTVFVEADSPQGQAWTAYYAGFRIKPRWRDCGRIGNGWYMPSALPPERSAVAA